MKKQITYYYDSTNDEYRFAVIDDNQVHTHGEVKVLWESKDCVSLVGSQWGVDGNFGDKYSVEPVYWRYQPHTELCRVMKEIVRLNPSYSDADLICIQID